MFVCLALVGKCFLRLVRHPTFLRGMGPKKKGGEGLSTMQSRQRGIDDHLKKGPGEIGGV